MADFDAHESAKWSLVTTQAVLEFEEVRDKTLGADAARGFSAVTGEGLDDLLDAGLKTKRKLGEANGKLYEEERTRSYELTEFQLKLAVAVAKLAMELYREELLNQISIEQTQEDVLKIEQQAEIERLNDAVEVRQAAIITAKANAQMLVTEAQLRLQVAERANLTNELSLAEAQLETAQAKLAIIAYIYQVVEAENLVLAAETRRAAALQITMAAEAEVMEVKRGMIPFYLQKAEAKEVLAEAVTLDAENRKQIELLGYQKNALKQSEADADSAVKQAELNFTLAADALARANDAVALTRATSQLAVQQAQTAARESAIEIRQGAEITKASIRWQADLDHTINRVVASLRQTSGRVGILAGELGPLLAAINSVGISEQAKVQASAREFIRTESESLTYRHILK